MILFFVGVDYMRSETGSTLADELGFQIFLGIYGEKIYPVHRRI